MRKIVAIFLAALMLLSLCSLVACKDDIPANEPIKDPSTDKVDPSQKEEKRIPLELPHTNYDGESFHILQWSANGVSEVGESWIPWEEGSVKEPSDMIGEAVFERNAVVEEKMGVSITSEYVSVDQG